MTDAPVDAAGEPAELPAAAATRPTLAVRLAERSRQRALRAERLARLRPPPGQGDDEAERALQEFLRALTGAPADEAVPATTPTPEAAAEPAAVLHFQRPERPVGRPLPPTAGAESVSELERLPGVGPNLVWALERAGIAGLVELAGLAPADLVDRLGPIGRLVPAAAWIAAARAATPPA